MTTERPRVLLYGDFWEASFENTWLGWLREWAYSVQAFDHPVCVRRLVPVAFVRKVAWRLAPRLLAWHVGRELYRAALAFQPDLLLVVSGYLVTRHTLQAIKSRLNSTLFHSYGEDFFNLRNTGPTLREAAPLYDCFFTTKSFNVAEMAALGMRQVVFLPHAYCEDCHYPVQVSQEDIARYGSALVFVGTWEAERAAVLETLRGFDVRVWGNGWNRLPRHSWLRSQVQGRPVYCAEMSRVMNSSKICLAFLRKANRDLHTSRTFEIPAVGCFQLSERTDEILGFFEEGREIECFASAEELQDKARYYLQHEGERRRIAEAGFRQVRQAGHGYGERLRTILAEYSGKAPGRVGEK